MAASMIRAGDDLLQRAMALAGIGAWSCALADERLTWSEGTYDIFGIPRGVAIDRRDTVSMYLDESRALMERVRREAIARQGAFTVDAEIRRLDGERRWMRLRGDVVMQAGRVVELYGLKQDITEERRQLDALRLLADSDALTGLSNRRLFQERFLDLSALRLRVAGVSALILIDVDGFKAINDRHGHDAGDACLRSIAARLSGAFARSAMVARIGGDEFAIVATAISARNACCTGCADCCAICPRRSCGKIDSSPSPPPPGSPGLATVPIAAMPCLPRRIAPCTPPNEAAAIVCGLRRLQAGPDPHANPDAPARPASTPLFFPE